MPTGFVKAVQTPPGDMLWMRLLSVSATQIVPSGATEMPVGLFSSPAGPWTPVTEMAVGATHVATVSPAEAETLDAVVAGVVDEQRAVRREGDALRKAELAIGRAVASRR